MVKKPISIDKKRHGVHRTHNKHFVKVYWPYLPGALLLVLTLLLVWLQPANSVGVQAYATSISTDSLLGATNEQRTKNGAKTLTSNAALNTAAQAKAQDMASRDYWSHATPDGKDPWIFIQQAGYKYQKAGENLAYGFSDSASTVSGWMNSATHRANLLDKAYSEVGFGFANSPNFVGEGPETIVVAMYGTPVSSAQAPATAETPSTDVMSEQNAVTSSTEVVEPPTRQISLVETVTKGDMPWAFFAVGLVSGGASSALLVRHSLKLRKLFKKGEKFVVHHPVIDTGLMLIVVASLLLSKGVGFIR